MDRTKIVPGRSDPSAIPSVIIHARHDGRVHYDEYIFFFRFNKETAMVCEAKVLRTRSTKLYVCV
jgi:hypothetical protein